MGNYEGFFVDALGADEKCLIHANSDADAIAVMNDLAGKSDASWIQLIKAEDLVVDKGTYPNFQDSAKPVAGCTVRQQAELQYGVTTPQNHLIVSIPAVDPSYVSLASPRSSTDPGNGTGKLVDEEGTVTTSFNKGEYRFRKRKGL